MTSAPTDLDRLLDQLEAMLSQDVPEAEAIAAWKTAFDAAAAAAPRDAHWTAILARAHALGVRVQERVAALQGRMAGLAQESLAQDAGRRALQGYGSSTGR